MRSFAFLLACLACPSHGRRVESRSLKAADAEASSQPFANHGEDRAAAESQDLKSFSLLLLALNAASGWQTPGPVHNARLPVSSQRSGTPRAAVKQAKPPGLKARSWQARLDKAFLGLDAPVQSRIRFVQRAIADPKFQKDLQKSVRIIRKKGMGKGHPEVIDTLWPQGTTARADIESLVALRNQVPELLEDLQKQVQQSPPSFSLPSNSPTTLPDPTTVFNSLVDLATDRKKQKELQEEAKDLLRSTPKGLETPKYEVVGTIDGPLFLGKPERIELRAYEEFTVARTVMKEFAFGSTSGGQGFTTLATYLFGKNEAKEAMAMTMPVEIASSPGSGAGSMTFVLPKKYASAPPTPLADSDVSIDTVPARLVAVKAFGGIVTDQEVERQKTALLEALAEDGSVTPVDASQISVLQYNSPLTVPWRRRNEIAIVVTEKVATDNDEASEVPIAADTSEVTEEVATEVKETMQESETPAPESKEAPTESADSDEVSAAADTSEVAEEVAPQGKDSLEEGITEAEESMAEAVSEDASIEKAENEPGKDA